MEYLEEEIKPLIKDLEELLNGAKGSIWGHGTPSKEVAEKINAEGIIGNEGYTLDNIAIPLSDNAKTSGENAQNIALQSLRWPHKDAKYISLLHVPDGFRNMDMIEDIEVEGRARKRVNKEKIIGFIDTLNLALVRNTDFNPESKPSGLKYTQGIEGSSVLKEGTSRPVPIPAPSEQTDADDQDVW